MLGKALRNEYCRRFGSKFGRSGLNPTNLRRMAKQPRVEITFCTQCRWLLRAAWVAQELITTFPDELGETALVPGSGGVFEIRVDDELIWSRKQEGRFPEITELKQLVRDRIAPEKDLGHSDRHLSGGADA